MAKKTTQKFTLSLPTYKKSAEDTVLSFDRFDHRERLYRVENHILVTDVAFQAIVDEINTQRETIAALDARLKEMVKK